MKHLNEYLAQKNLFNGLFGQPALSADNPKDFQAILDMLECDMSPENLTCDGMVTGRSLMIKANQLTRAKTELEKLMQQSA